MNDRIKHHYDIFGRTVTLGKGKAADFGPKSALPGYFNDLGVVTEMHKAKAGQLGGSGADVTEGLIGAIQVDLQLIAESSASSTT